VLKALSQTLACQKGTKAHIEERRLSARVGVQSWR